MMGDALGQHMDMAVVDDKENLCQYILYNQKLGVSCCIRVEDGYHYLLFVWEIERIDK